MSAISSELIRMRTVEAKVSGQHTEVEVEDNDFSMPLLPKFITVFLTASCSLHILQLIIIQPMI